ncbi:MAG: TonB-dependent receptor [Paludibacteraceae bacterium]|nr:TonB-dependent receptor [Paludibacteraceae bacterium]
MKIKYIIILCLSLLLSLSLNARQMRLYGYVLDTDNRGLDIVSVGIKGSGLGTTTNRNGFYDLTINQTDTFTIIFQLLGYQTLYQPIRLPNLQDVVNINAVLQPASETLEEVVVTDIRRQENTMDRLEIEQTRLMPDASGGNIESLLITFAGVSQSNELSSQYNVRGGSYEENSVYVNGIEIHRPLLIRAGQQEGLSFVNPYMTEDLQFSAGGFDAQYGDKLSSVLSITYKRPKRFEASLSASLLGANAYIGVGDSTYSMMHSVRYKTAQYLLGTLQTKGSYKPNFVDYQTFITWKLGKKEKRKTSRWEMSFLGNFSQNSYRFRPDSMSNSFGTYQVARKLNIYYEGQERDMFRTAFAALGLKYQAHKGLTLNFNVNGFYSSERENYDILGEYILTNNPMTGERQPNTEHGEQLTSDTISVDAMGTGTFQQHARNRLQAGVVQFAHNGEWKKAGNTLSWGVSVGGEWIKDDISEWERQDSMGYSLPNNPDKMDLYYTLKGSTDMRSVRLQAYAQDSYRWSTDGGNVILTGGVRMNWWSYNKELLFSPRLSLTYFPGWKHDFSFRFATGLYYQSPFYKELRDTITDEYRVTRIVLNKDIKAQRSVHAVLGADYYFRAWGRPFKLTAEAYYKYMDRIISYTVDNVRVRYSGENDAKGYAAGLDLKLFGELVPGAESWISFSIMTAKERLLNDKYGRGWIAGPNESRYSFSMLFQDYIPRLPQYKVHLRFIWQDGLPFSSPRSEQTRSAFRMSDYRRIDIGATRVFSAKKDKWMRKAKHVEQWMVGLEVFNIVGFKNVNSYFWVSAYDGTQWASPNYLTGRMFNFRLAVDFK